MIAEAEVAALGIKGRLATISIDRKALGWVRPRDS